MKWYLSPRWSIEITDCSMPMTFDQYSNCFYSCLYCFSQYQRCVGEGKNNYIAKKVFTVNVEKVKRIFTLKDESQFSKFIEEKKVMQWGGLSDPFCEFERKLGVGLELLRFFREIDYPICFSTKGVWWLNDPRYTELFKNNKKWNVKVSIITMEEEKARKIEIGVPTPTQRLDAIEKIASLNCGGATLRLRPFIIGVSNPRHIELIEAAGDKGATALSTEFFCLEVRSTILRKRLKILSELAGYDIFNFYRKYSALTGYLRLNRNVKRPFMNEMEDVCRRKGMRFYVSDAHFKERCDNGSCCGLTEDWNYSRGQFCEALMIAKKKGCVSWSDISKHLEYAKKFLWARAQGYNNSSTGKRVKFNNFTMYDYLHYIWNNPDKSGQSPYKMFEGILKPSVIDAKGDVVYVIDKERL